ncbi:DUF1871 family protein [Thermaerobacillus caldiproteolyticus]|uniref:DUF1871 domain-containing protein n=1 Tax=Thermaerobacillus caldiproteolyticus TaxID=247480 RepID=A0A7V9Z7V0_9BACL|nr:DUF1871 family protein [Anoxybacillus caldiproteolyticus]MBA2875596.1 hypothetical protein [Anoxybacillus caldiproteolyticus]QPA30517.1 DUF1871 family protein [Anoxybacillus caldiproteolyticus]
MDMQQVNQMLVRIIQRWDPLGYGCDAYETEAVDVLQAVHEYDELYPLAKKIQAIYEFSFEEVIPLEQCMKIAKQLLELKQAASCQLP